MNFIPAKAKASQREKKLKSTQNEKSAFPKAGRRFL
jgi:hypothetical protein